LIDISTQLVTSTFSATLDDIPGFVPSTYYNTLGGGGDVYNKVTVANGKYPYADPNQDKIYNEQYPQLGYSITTVPYSLNLGQVPINFALYTLNLSALLLADFGMYGQSFYLNSLSANSVPDYASMVRFITFVQGTKGKFPGSSTPYLSSSPLTLLTTNEVSIQLQPGGYVNEGNPLGLKLYNWFINEIYTEGVVANLQTLN
jgi:hypothetical protein